MSMNGLSNWLKTMRHKERQGSMIGLCKGKKTKTAEEKVGKRSWVSETQKKKQGRQKNNTAHGTTKNISGSACTSRKTLVKQSEHAVNVA